MSAAGPGPGGPERAPGSMLEVYMHAIASRANDDFLDQINLGIGNYTNDEYWQQVKAFRKGLFADSSITRRLVERAVLETKMEMVDAIYDERDSARILQGVDYPEPKRDRPRHAYLEDEMDEVWRNLGYRTDEEQYTTEEHQAWLIHEVTGLDYNWVPPQWRMLKMRHEASRSKDAHLLDDLFGRPPEPTQAPDMKVMDDFEE